MKFVAANDFYNTPVFDIKFTDADKKSEFYRGNDQHIYKGFRFSIGAPETAYADLQVKQKELAGLLIKHRLAVIDDKTNNETGVIAKIDKLAKDELAARKADEKAAKDAQSTSMASVLKQLSDVVALLTAKKA